MRILLPISSGAVHFFARACATDLTLEHRFGEAEIAEYGFNCRCCFLSAIIATKNRECNYVIHTGVHQRVISAIVGAVNLPGPAVRLLAIIGTVFSSDSTVIAALQEFVVKVGRQIETRLIRVNLPDLPTLQLLVAVPTPNAGTAKDVISRLVGNAPALLAKCVRSLSDEFYTEAFKLERNLLRPLLALVYRLCDEKSEPLFIPPLTNPQDSSSLTSRPPPLAVVTNHALKLLSGYEKMRKFVASGYYQASEEMDRWLKGVVVEGGVCLVIIRKHIITWERSGVGIDMEKIREQAKIFDDDRFNVFRIWEKHKEATGEWFLEIDHIIFEKLRGMFSNRRGLK
jgi:hypothetical protein